MSDPVTTRLPNETHIVLRLNGAREQLAILHEALRDHRYVVAEAAVCAIVDQAAKAVTAALHGFNLLLPQPLPAERVSWRNLRARFVSVQAESAVLDLIEEHLRPRSGWLWWLDRKEHASTFAPLLRIDAESGSVALWRDPLDPTQGTEPGSPDEYFTVVLERVEELVREIGRSARRDAEQYRQAARRQPGRIA
ncbi:MAG: hypothetical protein RMK01_03835 [Thermomicrobium sp.]|nr:hypothetical protein [Thermomicrobium sp.]MDW8059183.1 hypothetical protein [Thermomicrobium sp.]